MEGALDKLPPSGSASSELQGIIEQLDLLQDISGRVIDKFGDFSRSINGIKLTIRKITLALEELKQQLAKREDHITVFRDTRVDI